METRNIVNKIGSSLFLKWLPALCLLFGVIGAWGTAQIKQAGLQFQTDENQRRIIVLESQVRALQERSATKEDVKESTERIIRELDQIQKVLADNRSR